ncbi:hypothetical protein CMQ_7516 [Grosmannia clavigera kw1407]|uniref:Uncharacterized protein n=1 Tax=Grosmannia clavigera (strain kw1407 / UAMH 11150) TaxID=655863 RepID=F0XP86_GROCL|nr:uncharacterized protein CMQ_7516 [Grosmannia clavigera kw1407]EFX00514.1 hypothetical protein CMQ_7516 [Grosmannia clavigera kw1407]
MSRAIRRKAPAPSHRKSRRDSTSSSSSLDLSSDGGYSVLDEASESDDDDEDGVDATEEKYIIKDVVKSRHGRNADAVGAFRRNQIDQQLIYSNKATAESLAFSGPYIMGTLRGIKNGSLEAVATPITPPRRRKRHSISLRHDEYIRSPLGAAVQKRKASGPPAEGSAADHKRQRSISEVKDLML